MQTVRAIARSSWSLQMEIAVVAVPFQREKKSVKKRERKPSEKSEK